MNAKFASKLHNHFYVDDLNLGAYNVANDFDLYKKVKINLMNASFNVRKWQKNSEKLHSLINNYEKIFDNENFTTVENGKFLGVTWNKTWNSYLDILIIGLRDIFVVAVNITPEKETF